MLKCRHEKTLVDVIGQIVRDCPECYAKYVADWEKSHGGPAKRPATPGIRIVTT